MIHRRDLPGLFLILILLLLAACAAPPPGPASPHRGSRRDDLLRRIRPHFGKPHCMGGEGPRCFDCSGLVRTVLGPLGVELPRRSRDQVRRGKAVPLRLESFRPGDLVFFRWDGGGISHVGIYLGRGEFAHASVRSGVTISEIREPWYWSRLVAVRRVLP